MDRVTIAQKILDTSRDSTYLEIGVNTGSSFIPIRANKKWGVDPCYQLTMRRLLKYRVCSLLGIKDERVFLMTSDEFFENSKLMLASHGVDVCLVDGLHTYEQALKDVLNALKYLKPRGIILVHDCNPTTELMALPATNIEEMIHKGISGWDGAWSGDVWRAIVHLRALRGDVNTFVLECDTGIGVVTKGQPISSLSYTEEEIRRMDYGTLCRNRQALLGLQPSQYFADFLATHLRNRAES